MSGPISENWDAAKIYFEVLACVSCGAAVDVSDPHAMQRFKHHTCLPGSPRIVLQPGGPSRLPMPDYPGDDEDE